MVLEPAAVIADTALVRRLLAAQFPQWASLPVAPVRDGGTEHAVHRLGADLVVRLPLTRAAAAQVHRDHHWLPRLAPHLPLAVPQPQGRGRPGYGFAFPWAVHSWLDGQTAQVRPPVEPREAAAALGGFVAALRAADATGAPPSSRGRPLRVLDARVRAAVAGLRGVAGLPAPEAVLAVWREALAVPPWAGPPVWTHGELVADNLLVRDGRWHAVLDFGALGAGDPACDMIGAWTVTEPGHRAVFRAASGADDGTWARGRGWALALAVQTLSAPRRGGPALVPAARQTLIEVLGGRR